MARSRSRSPRRRLSPDRRDRKRSRSPERGRDGKDKERTAREEADIAAKKAKAEAEYSRKKRMEVVKQMTGGHSESEGEEEGAIYDDDEEGVDAEERAMRKLMGFTGFDSTKGKPVEDNVKGAAKGTVRKGSQRTYRQYMNRKGGFNRPLDKIK